MPNLQKKTLSRQFDELRLYLTPRFLFGIALIISAIFAVLLIRESSNQWINVLSATRSLSPGSVINEGDFTTVGIRATSGVDEYLDRSAPIIGATVLRAIGEGELIPSAALTTQSDPTMRHLALSIASGELPLRLGAGESVDIYAVPKETIAQQSKFENLQRAELLLADIGIDGIDRGSRDFGGNTTITFLIPDRYIERVLSASITSKLVIVSR